MFVLTKIFFFLLWGNGDATPFIARECAEACKFGVVISGADNTKKQQCFDKCSDEAYKAARAAIKRYKDATNKKEKSNAQSR